MFAPVSDEDEEDFIPPGKYDFSDEKKEDFEEVRAGPKGRAAVFVPEILLIRRRKQEEEKKKVAPRPTIDIFSEAAFKLYPEAEARRRQLLEYTMNANLRNIDDLDPYILVVAADLRLTYPNGINLEGFPDRSKLSYEVMSSQAVSNLASAILNVHGKVDKSLVDRVKMDIIAYYLLFG